MLHMPAGKLGNATVVQSNQEGNLVCPHIRRKVATVVDDSRAQQFNVRHIPCSAWCNAMQCNASNHKASKTNSGKHKASKPNPMRCKPILLDLKYVTQPTTQPAAE